MDLGRAPEWNTPRLKSQFKISLKSAICSHSRLFTCKKGILRCTEHKINLLSVSYILLHFLFPTTELFCTRPISPARWTWLLNTQLFSFFVTCPAKTMQYFLIHAAPPPPKVVLSFSAGLSVAECLLSIYVSTASVIKCSSTSILCQRWVYSGLLHSSLFFLFCFFFVFNWAPAGFESYNQRCEVCLQVKSSD